ncbi:MAG: DUF58 domain-containing protein [Clostridia bacterium]|nr:DUF58 domain-containing protein [Clostridia bacterium]
MEIILKAFTYLLIAIGVFVAVMILNALYRKVKTFVIGRLEYTREFSEEEVVEGERVVITEVIYNPTPLPMFFIDIISYINGELQLENMEPCEGMQEVISRFHLLPFTKITRRHRAVCTKRGCYRMTSASVMAGRKTWEYDKTFSFLAELFVLPRPIPHPFTSRSFNLVQGAASSPNKIVLDPFSVIGIRDFAPGDPFNMINFKATARCSYNGARGIKVNELDSCSDRIIMIYLNFQTPKDYDGAEGFERKMEYALSLCANIIEEASRDGHRVGFGANCPHSDGGNRILFPISSGSLHAKEIVREISRIPIRCSSSFFSLLDGGIKNDIARTEVIVITPCIDENIEKGTALLRRRNAVTVIQV